MELRLWWEEQLRCRCARSSAGSAGSWGWQLRQSRGHCSHSLKAVYHSPCSSRVTGWVPVWQANRDKNNNNNKNFSLAVEKDSWIIRRDLCICSSFFGEESVNYHYYNCRSFPSTSGFIMLQKVMTMWHCSVNLVSRSLVILFQTLWINLIVD